MQQGTDNAEDRAEGWLSTAETARRLGVKPQTVYAYVSRGLLARRPGPDGRTSRFAPADVERLARRARHGGRAGALEVVVDTELTLLDAGGRLFFRGRDATELARFRSFEHVATLLWDAGDPATPWEAPAVALRVGRAAQAALPPDARPIDRMRVVAAAIATTDPLRDDRRPAAVRAAGRALVAAVVAEYLLAVKGLGYFIRADTQSLHENQAMVGVVMLAVIGIAINYGIDYATSRFLPWYRREAR